MEHVKKKLSENSVRVIKISKKALFEFLYESFINDQEDFLDVDTLEVSNIFDINFDRGEFIFCAYKSEDSDGKLRELPEEIDFQQLMKNIPDTTTTMYSGDRYKDYNIDELIKFSKQ